MATYPVDQGGKGSKIKVLPDSGIQLSTMADGSVRGFSDYAEIAYTLTVEHFWLETADRNAVFDFYDADPFGLHTVITEDEGTYSARFTNKPLSTERSGNYCKVVSELVGTKV